jgi:hypothetical protein
MLGRRINFPGVFLFFGGGWFGILDDIARGKLSKLGEISGSDRSAVRNSGAVDRTPPEMNKSWVDIWGKNDYMIRSCFRK